MTTDASAHPTGPGQPVCRYCRLVTDPAGPSCPHCGAPIDVRAVVSRSGWVKQPGIVDLARIQFGRSRVQIEGSQVPVADVDLSGDEWIYFSHHSLLWTQPSVRLSASNLAGGLTRMLSGMPLIMMEARGPGHLALADNHAGDLIALPLTPGREIWVREHRFLTATGNVFYAWENTNIWFVTGSGDDRETHYPLGMIGDRFTARDTPGLLLVHAPGNTFLRDLAPGETILVQPSSLLYRDVTVDLHLHLEYPRSQGVSWWNSFEQRTVWLRLIGPGRVAVQSVFEHPEGRAITDHSPATVQRW